MNKAIFAAAALASATAAPAQAANDAGLQLQGSARSATRAMGATASLVLRLGDTRNVRASERTRLSLTAGPVIALAGHDGTRRGVIQMAGFDFRPGFSASFNLAGRPVVRAYTVLGAAEADKRDGGKGRGPSTLGWIGIGAGVLVGALGVTYLAYEDAIDCTENGQYVCE